jgi:hypothetical protein
METNNMSIDEAIGQFKLSNDYQDYLQDGYLYNISYWLEKNNLSYCKETFIEKLHRKG